MQEAVRKLQDELLNARKDIAETRKQSTDAIARAEELEKLVATQREELKAAVDREEALQEQLRTGAALGTAAKAEQSAQIPGLQALPREAFAREADLLKQVRELQIKTALPPPSTGQGEEPAQISSMQAQIEGLQKMLEQAEQQHQLEVAGLQEQLARSGTPAESYAEGLDPERSINAWQSLLKQDGNVMRKAETLERFLASSRNLSMGKPEQAKFSEFITKLID